MIHVDHTFFVINTRTKGLVSVHDRRNKPDHTSLCLNINIDIITSIDDRSVSDDQSIANRFTVYRYYILIDVRHFRVTY